MLLSNSNKQYVISLDNLDLNLLGKYINKPNDGKQVLWSRPSQRRDSECYEVSILINDEQINDYVVNEIDTTSCHICNVEVPLPFYKRHLKSKQHENFKKLIAKIFENVSKQIDDITTDTPENINEYIKYYCDICSKVLSRKNRSKHKKTTTHLKSLQKQKIIDSFIDLYVENKDVEIEIKKELHQDTDSSASKNTTLNSSRDVNDLSNIELSTPKKESNNEVDKQIPTTSHNINQSVSFHSAKSNESVQQKSEEQIISNTNSVKLLSKTIKSDKLNIIIDSDVNKYFYSYAKTVMLKHKVIFKVPRVEDNNIVIVTPNGYEQRIKLSTFHGFENHAGFLYCQLCETWVAHKELNITNHINTKDHVLNISQPVSDSFSRESAKHKGLVTHCLVCNIIVRSGSNHPKINENHRAKLDTKPATLNEEKVNPNTILKYCDVCCIDIQSHNFDNHVNANKHKINLIKKEASLRQAELQEQNTSSQSAKITSPNKESMCHTCNVLVPPGGMSIHERGKPHMSAVIMKSVKAFAANNQPGTSTSSTNRKEDKFISYKKQLCEVNENVMYCEKCDVDLPNIRINIIEHIEGHRHKHNVKKNTDQNVTVQPSTAQQYCEICKIYVSGSIIHMTEDLGHNKKYILNNRVDKDMLRKFVYDEPQTKSRIALAYREVHKELLRQNNITSKKNIYKCNVCNIQLCPKSEISHLFGDRHRSNRNSNL